MRYLYHEAKRVAAWAILILPGLVTLGCDRPLPVNPVIPLDTQILMFVETVDDYSRSTDELRRIKPFFAPGSEPSKEGLLRYMAYRYEGKSPVVSGDSATVTILFKDAKTGNPAGEMQWSIVKVDGQWRLKDAPLPGVAK